MTDQERLKQILDSMDVPETRKDASNPANKMWLLRNLGVRNREHDDFQEAIDLIKG